MLDLMQDAVFRAEYPTLTILHLGPAPDPESADPAAMMGYRFARCKCGLPPELPQVRMCPIAEILSFDAVKGSS